MKKLRLVTGMIFAVVLCCALALSANAKWWDENPFDDVESGAWYYDAVRICNENGLFAGTSQVTFGTNTGMSRAMLVTVLSADDESYNSADYTTSSFNDVEKGSWYMAPVEWASEKGIVSGIGEGAFGPTNILSRQELALMLMKYAEYKGMDISVSEETDLGSYPDEGEVSSWAYDAVKWAVEKGLISGTSDGTNILLSPRGTATRATVAQIMVKFLSLNPVYEINGNDLSLYKIVYNPNESGQDSSTESSARTLAEYISFSIGIDLDVVSDETEVSDYEILVGRTNREEKGIVSVDLEALGDPQKFICQVQGNYLVVCGTDSDSDNDTGDRNTYNVDGTENAVYYLLEEMFGMNFYFSNTGRGEGITATPDPVISFEDGYTYIDGPEFETRTLYIADAGSEGYLGCGYYYSEWGCGLPHQLGNLMTGVWRETYENTWDTPCLSDPDNIESLIQNIRELLAEKPTKNLVGLIQNDSDDYCRCDDCMEAYREAGSRCGALIKLCNLVCETFEEEYPNVKFATWAYTWSAKPPKDMELHKNIVLVYNTLVLCPAHEYSDANCQYNDTSEEYIKTWGELADHLYLWDHSGAFTDSMTPFPDFDSMRPNANYFYENGVEGVFMNSLGGRVADFCELRTYLFARLYRKPQMGEDEFNYRMNGFLKAYYGEGWQSIRSYIDLISKLANSKCHTFHSPTGGYYDYNEVLPYVDTIEAYWDAAEAKAANAQQLENIQITRLSWTYLRQNVLFESQFTNGTEAEREAYKAANQKLYDDVNKYDLCFGENADSMRFSPSSKPEDWQG